MRNNGLKMVKQNFKMAADSHFGCNKTSKWQLTRVSGETKLQNGS